MKVAAIYARKSTDQQVADDDKSVTRQVANARAFAAAQGWTVDDRFIFVDDGVSGAEFDRRPGFVALMASLKGHGFNVLLMSEESRLGRSTNEVPYALGRLNKAGVEVWCYRDKRRVTLDTPMEKFMVSATSFSSDMERWLAQQRTAEAMLQKAKLGHVTGGKVFGYDNVRKDGHVEREVNSREADIIIDIFTRYAKGEGFKQIAHALNAQKVPSPRPQRGRPAGWDPGTVRAVLRRPLYRGTSIYNRTKKRDSDGARHKGRQPKRHQSDWVIVDVPHLRVIDEALARQVDKRLSDRRNAYLRDAKGHLLGSPRRHGHNPTRHLLAGFIVCACGATFEAVRGYYVCSARRRKGTTICGSEFSFAVEAIEQVFLDALEGVVLTDSFITHVLDLTFASHVAPDLDAMAIERKRLATETTNLTTAIAAGGDIPALVKALEERQSRLDALDAKLAAPAEMPDRDVLRAALELRTADWRGILRGPHVEQARLVLKHLLDLPIRGLFNEPKPKWVAAARPEGLAVGLVQSVASPPGFEPGFQP